MALTFPDLVYLLCFVTSGLCALLLSAQYRRSPSPLLLWSAACFVFLALSNLMVVVDQLVLVDRDLKLSRLVLTLIAVSLLLFGFIWEAEKE